MHVRLLKFDGSLRPLDSIIDDVLLLAIEHCNGKKSAAARNLGVARSTFYTKLKRGA